MGILWFAAGFAVASVIFIVWGVKNQQKIAQARAAILKAYDEVGDKIGGFVEGIDKKLDKEIAERKK
tara:strand:+ start:4510 stop:4710 length:201 start_codon:yes stop_codon:yes gene_type:complete